MSSRRVAVLPLAMVTIAVLLSACNGPDVSATARCDDAPYVEGEEPSAPRVSLIMVDLSSNTEAGREAIGEAIRPVVTEAVEKGGVIRLVVSGGSGEPMQPSPCLDGKTVLHTDYKNSTREQKEQAAAISGIEGDVAAMLAGTEVSDVGNLTNLIAQIPDQLDQIELPAGVTGDAQPRQVVLVSDLDSKAARGDCMSVDGIRASAKAAAAIVERCIELHQYLPLPADVEMEVVRPQLTPGDSTASRMSGFLADSLCVQMNEEQGKCPNSES